MNIEVGEETSPYASTFQARRRGMWVHKINASINAVEWKTRNLARGETIFVCDATQEEWNAFVDDCDGQALRSACMEYVNGKVLIVELSSNAHEAVTFAIDYLFRTNAALSPYFCGIGATYVSTRQRLEPDVGLGPNGSTLPAANLLNGIEDWFEYHTLKVEVGVSQDWGAESGQLDWKANQWTLLPGVEYVLCVSIDKNVQNGTYKLYSVDNPGHVLPYQDPEGIVAPRTVVAFDAHRLLGLPAGANLPPNVPDHVLDLHAVLLDARFRLRRR